MRPYPVFVVISRLRCRFGEEHRKLSIMSRFRNLIVVVVVMLVVAGCAKAAEQVLEEAIEQQIENEGGSGEVDIDLDDDGGVSIETEEGSIQIGGNEIPDDFLLPIPDYEELMGVTTFTGDETGASVSLTFDPDDFDEVVELYADFFSDQGWEVGQTDTSSGDQRVVIITGTGDEVSASAILGYTEGDDTANLTANYGSN